ncbi:hypothetical protein [Cypionkella sp.]|uniref:hypothetical protein n=1 Tax=Cypionkella sp. TaxID=2811411 RepID=UPI00260B7FA7|nr:hypothetical protein [Cypionkella sp.]
MPPPPQQGWVALSDRGLLNPAVPDALLHHGLFVMELALPLENVSLLLDYQANVGWPRTSRSSTTATQA